MCLKQVGIPGLATIHRNGQCWKDHSVSGRTQNQSWKQLSQRSMNPINIIFMMMKHEGGHRFF